MAQTIEVKLPDIGDFDQVDIIEVLVAVGDAVDLNDSLLVLESDKASMEIPSPAAGIVTQLHVRSGGKIAQGGPILQLEITQDQEPTHPMPASPVAPIFEAVRGTPDLHAEVLVLGGGPGGYTAAFRAADLGKKVILVEKDAQLGGVCLNVGCIPSKALLHVAEVIHDARHLESQGVSFGAPRIDLDQIRAGKDAVVAKLTGGLQQLAKQRQVQVIRGYGRFESPQRLAVLAEGQKTSITFDYAIIAAGSRPVQIPGFPHDDPRVLDSTGALALTDIPEHLLVIGGGIIGLEMATVYSTLGSQVDIVELQDQLIPGADKDLARTLQKHLKSRVRHIWLKARVRDIQAKHEGLKVLFDGEQVPETADYDKVLVAVGRTPNGRDLCADRAGVKINDRGFIPVDAHMRTNVPNIFAIGDIVGQPMLAHKATHEAKVAAEVICGLPALFDPLAIPSVAYTDPEIAWMGLTEEQAKASKRSYEKAVFPWAASGRALGMGRDEGFTKLLFDPDTRALLGAAICGRHAGELIGEAMLALEMGADMEDLALTIHPHPTLVETLGLAAELAEGSITDLLPKRR